MLVIIRDKLKQVNKKSVFQKGITKIKIRKTSFKKYELRVLLQRHFLGAVNLLAC